MLAARKAPLQAVRLAQPTFRHESRDIAAHGFVGVPGLFTMNGTAARRSPSPSVPSWATSQPFPASPAVGDALAARAPSGRVRVGLLRQVTYVAIDVAMVCIGGILVFWLAFQTTTAVGRFPEHIYAPAYPSFLLLYAALIVLACKSQHLYRTPKELSAIEETFTVAKAVGLATAVLVLFIFTSGNKEISRVVVTYAGALNVATLGGWRYAKRRYVFRRALRGHSASRVLIIGASKSGRAFAAWLEANRHLGYSVRGFLDAHPDGDARVLGSVPDLHRIALAEFVDQLFVALPAERELVKQVFLEARRLRLDLNVVPDLYDGLGWHAPVHSIGGFPVLELHGQPIPAFGLAVKRALDVVLGSLILILTTPLLSLAALLISLDSPGSIFYSALRVGKKGQKFRCYKLRTMVAGADQRKEVLRPSNQRNGPTFKIDNDPRVTRSGAFLRKFSIDELPQIINVILGDMSLVGPRPHPLDDFELYRVEDLRRLDVKPGITGLWQVTARRDPSFETNMALDLQYIENWSLALDLKILLRTLPAVLRAEGN
jgi:exopolysaccharide biosynthesis polyprenyl glycosylphosphotransferase